MFLRSTFFLNTELMFCTQSKRSYFIPIQSQHAR